MLDLVWRETFRVRFYDAEPSGRVSLPALCRYLQEAADSHCRQVGVSLVDLRAAGRTWVLSRLTLELADLPRLGDELVVETWGAGRLGGARACRDFRFLNGDGSAFGAASSVWLILDVASRRPVRLPESVLRFRHPDPPATGPTGVDSLAAPERPTLEERFQVRWRDLDINGHANNVAYVEWIIETVPAEIRRVGMPAALDIHFLDEALLGRDVVAVAEQAGPRVYRHGLRADDTDWLALARTEWRMPSPTWR